MTDSKRVSPAELKKTWICCQIGAREHYSIPRAILNLDNSIELFTDVWATPGNSWLLPERWKQRQHAEIPDQCVHSWTLESVLRKTSNRFLGRNGWTAIIEQDKWFQRKVCSALRQIIERCATPPIVFAYSYAAREIFQLAKSLGCTTILGQIDPALVEVELVQKIEQRHNYGMSGWPPPSYWEDWHEECELADVILANSEWAKAALLQQGICAKKLTVVPLAFEKPIAPVECSPAPKQFSHNRPLRILFLGQVILRKGIAELTEAAVRLADTPVEWRVVGGGSVDLLNQLRSLSNVVVTGQLSRGEVAHEYETADVFILPTHSDGFALTQLEAAAYGLPIIASSHCGDVVTDHKNGLLLPEVSAAAISDAVREIIESPRLLQEFRINQMERLAFGIRDLGKTLMSLEQGGKAQ